MHEVLELHSRSDLVDILERKKQVGIENKERNVTQLIDKVKYQAYLWARVRISMLELSLNMVIYKLQEIFWVP